MKRMGLILWACGWLAAWSAAADRYWVASSDSNWNDTANWSASSGGASGASVPLAGDVAIFDGGSVFSCAIDVDVNVFGMLLTNGYTGTVTQGADRTMTLSSHFTQYDGTFVGGNADMTISGSGCSFTLTNGTFTATSGTLTIGSTLNSSHTVFTFRPAATFHPNGGTLKFRSWYSRHDATGNYHDMNLNGPLTVNHLVYSGGNYHENSAVRPVIYRLGTDDTWIVEGNFTCEGDTAANENATVWTASGVIQVYGDVAIKPGTAASAGGSRFWASPTTVEMTGSAAAKYIYTGGRGPGLRINKTDAAVTPETGTTNLAVAAFFPPNNRFALRSAAVSVFVVSHGRDGR